MTKRDFVAAAAGALAASALLAGVALAAIPDSNGVIQGCYNSGGNLKVVSELPCPKGWTSLPWNQEGPKGDPGTDGVSPTVTQLSPGDANCPTGGAALIDATGSTAYVCNGAAGADGESFAGTFTSPNGEYSITVSDTGITLAHGTTNSIVLTGDDLAVHSDDISLQSDRSTMVQAGTTVDVQAAATATFDASGNLSITTDATGLFHAGGPLNLQGSVVNIN
jgi:hypothetical protein